MKNSAKDEDILEYEDNNNDKYPVEEESFRYCKKDTTSNCLCAQCKLNRLFTGSPIVFAENIHDATKHIGTEEIVDEYDYTPINTKTNQAKINIFVAANRRSAARRTIRR
jgi:hypothetical protein